VGTIAENITIWQWALVILTSTILLLISPWAKSSNEFYKAEKKGKTPNVLMLTGSLVISWVFAKSITNASSLGYSFGMMGGIAYAGYYLSFIVAGIVIYSLRKHGNFTSIHHFLQTRFGRGSLVIFSIVIAFRLFNEIWSNTMVIGMYFGDVGSTGYYTSIVVFTLLTLAYSLKGGLSSSIFSDVIQMGLFSILLIIILTVLFNDPEVSIAQVTGTGSFSWELGLNLFFAAILQSFSYPFHDPVMTDRGFISSEKTTLKSFILAGIIGGVCILLFSFLGIIAKIKGVPDGALQASGAIFGTLILLLINFIMIVSAASTIDSTFSAFSKLAAVDLNLGKTVKFGRITMVIVAVAGTIPIFFNPAILSATTVSGTMVIGLTPVFLFWKIKAPPISFYLSVGVGIITGIVLALGIFPSQLTFTPGKYADLLWSNIFGVGLCILVYFIPLIFSNKNQNVSRG
jgi:Na+/proline symporter